MNPSILLTFLVCIVCWSHCSALAQPSTTVLPCGNHAHNDYLHQHPLHDALHYGFTSIEVDVRLVAGTLFVAHDKEDIRPFKTLSAVYLNPLLKIIKKNDGSVYPDGQKITLLIDMKSDGQKSWVALQKLWKKYDDSFAGVVTVLVSGNRDLDTMIQADQPWARYDGRLEDLKKHPDLPVISLISVKWTDVFSWTGKGTMPKGELSRLKSIIQQTHQQNRQLRFWNTDVSGEAAQESIWQLLLESGVDLIGTDKLEEFRNYCMSSDPTVARNSGRSPGSQGDGSAP